MDRGKGGWERTGPRVDGGREKATVAVEQVKRFVRVFWELSLGVLETKEVSRSGRVDFTGGSDPKLLLVPDSRF